MPARQSGGLLVVTCDVNTCLPAKSERQSQLQKVSHIDIVSVIDVGNWDQAEEVPTGSREKVTLIDPQSGAHHIFKYPKVRREHQLWSELLASFIAGDLLSWDVQHTSIATRGGRLGNLLGYVFEPGSKTVAQETFTEG